MEFMETNIAKIREKQSPFLEIKRSVSGHVQNYNFFVLKMTEDVRRRIPNFASVNR
jgi:hypothetical protein